MKLTLIICFTYKIVNMIITISFPADISCLNTACVSPACGSPDCQPFQVALILDPSVHLQSPARCLSSPMQSFLIKYACEYYTIINIRTIIDTYSQL